MVIRKRGYIKVYRKKTEIYLKVPHQGIHFALLYLRLFLDLEKRQPLHAIIFSVEYHQWTHTVAPFESSKYNTRETCLSAIFDLYKH